MKNSKLATQLRRQAEAFESQAKQLRAAADALMGGGTTHPEPAAPRKARKRRSGPTRGATRNMLALVSLRGPEKASTLARMAVQQGASATIPAAKQVLVKLAARGQIQRIGVGIYGPVNGRGAGAQA